MHLGTAGATWYVICRTCYVELDLFDRIWPTHETKSPEVCKCQACIAQDVELTLFDGICVMHEEQSSEIYKVQA